MSLRLVLLFSPEAGFVEVDVRAFVGCAADSDRCFPSSFMAAESPCIPGGLETGRRSAKLFNVNARSTVQAQWQADLSQAQIMPRSLALHNVMLYLWNTDKTVKDKMYYEIEQETKKF